MPRRWRRKRAERNGKKRKQQFPRPLRLRHRQVRARNFIRDKAVLFAFARDTRSGGFQAADFYKRRSGLAVRRSYSSERDRRSWGVIWPPLLLQQCASLRQNFCTRVRGILHRADARARKDERWPRLLAQDAMRELCRVLS